MEGTGTFSDSGRNTTFDAPMNVHPVQEVELSKEGRRPRFSASGVHAAHRLDGMKVRAVVCAAADGPIAARLRQRFPDPETLLIPGDREGLWQAHEVVSAASSVAITTCPRVAPIVELERARAIWPGARFVWFERWSRPELPPSSVRALSNTRLIGPHHDDVDAIVASLSEEIELGFEERGGQAALGQRFSRHYGLPGKAERLVVAIAMAVPSARWAALLGQDQERFRKYCSATVYPRVGVGTISDLIARLWDFERRGQSDVG